MGGLIDSLMGATVADLEEAKRRFDPVTWATVLAQVRLPKEGILDFESHRFLLDVYRDLHPDIVVLKGAQLGFSTWAIVRTLWTLLTFNCSVIYTFPTREQVSEYTSARINPIITNSAYISDRVLDVDSVRIKQFSHHPKSSPQRRFTGVSTVYFNGAQNSKDPTAVDADMLVHDEEDRANPQIIQQYESRIDHSQMKWKIRLSTPTIPGHGVHRGYMASDQRVWMIRCAGCNAEFELQFPRNIRPESWAEVEAGKDAYFVCHLCGRRIADSERAAGRWIAQITAQGLPHGYKLSQLAAPWRSAFNILKRQHDADYEGDFYNLVLGEPYQAGANLLSREVVLGRAVGPHRIGAPSDGAFMGVDVGKSIDVVVGDYTENGEPRTIYMGSHTDFIELDQLMQRFNVVTCVIDALPEERETKSFQQRWNMPDLPRIWRCVYREPSSQSAQRDVQWRDENSTTIPIVSAPRSETLTTSSGELTSRRLLPIFDGSPAWEDYLSHHENSKRVPVFTEGLERERRVDHYDWVSTGPDHFFHAATYEMLARMAPRDIAPPIGRALISARGGRRTGSRISPVTPPAVKVQRSGF